MMNQSVYFGLDSNIQKMVILGLSTAKRNVKELCEIKVRKVLNWDLKKVIKL